MKHSEPETNKTERGFTLMEIVVATAIFAMLASSIMTLFNYTLKINRRAEALRQTTQGMRNFVEFVVKEVRNGKIDYGVNMTTVQDQVSPCPLPDTKISGQAYTGTNSYEQKENRLGLVNYKGERECFFLATGSPSAETWVGKNVYTGKYLMLQKDGVALENLNPQNFTVEELAFFIRPRKDPYEDEPDAGGTGADFPKVQPAVQMSMKLKVLLPTGETVYLNYQTAVSTNKYDIPNRLN